MTPEERLATCFTCQNKHFLDKEGMVCGLTQAPPDFEDSCADYLKIERRSEATIESEYTSSTSSTRYIVQLVVSIVVIACGLFISILTIYTTRTMNIWSFLMLAGGTFGLFTLSSTEKRRRQTRKRKAQDTLDIDLFDD